jgi:late competence protein required for DNA uptake (superfamily II DNA/RNA helicase)
MVTDIKTLIKQNYDSQERIWVKVKYNFTCANCGTTALPQKWHLPQNSYSCLKSISLGWTSMVSYNRRIDLYFCSHCGNEFPKENKKEGEVK